MLDLVVSDAVALCRIESSRLSIDCILENLFASINGAKRISLDRFIYSLGIPQVGRAVSKLIAAFWGSYSHMLTCISEGKYDDLLSIDGIGQSIVDDIRNFCLNKHNMSIIKRLAGDERSSGYVIVNDVEQIKDGELAGKTIVFTGSLQKFSREEAKEIAERMGAKTASSVSSKTSFVVAGENAGSKLEEAKKKGIKILSEEDFEEIIKKKSQR